MCFHECVSNLLLVHFMTQRILICQMRRLKSVLQKSMKNIKMILQKINLVI